MAPALKTVVQALSAPGLGRRHPSDITLCAFVIFASRAGWQMEGDLQQTMTAAEEAEKAKQMMMERLKEMQSQMIVGQQLQAKAAKQEAELRRAQIAKASTS